MQEDLLQPGEIQFLNLAFLYNAPLFHLFSLNGAAVAPKPFAITKMLLDAVMLPLCGCGDGTDEFNSITKQEHRGQITTEVWSALCPEPVDNWQQA